MQLLIFLALIIWITISETFAFSSAGVNTVTWRSPSFILKAESGKPQTTSDSNAYLKHVCVSCQYVYDEEKGFKKRYPPGTRFVDLKTFNCPVCGASKEQFSIVPSEN
jgi:rubredoxin